MSDPSLPLIQDQPLQVNASAQHRITQFLCPINFITSIIKRLITHLLLEWTLNPPPPISTKFDELQVRRQALDATDHVV